MPSDSLGSRNQRKPRLLERDELWNYALKILAGRAQSIGELRDKLRRRAADPGVIDDILQRLKEAGALDDARFAEHFAQARKDSGSFGKLRVVRDLRQRRIAPGLATEAAQDAYQGSDELEMIDAFLKRKFRSVNLSDHLKDPKHLASAFRKLRYAGFSVGPSIRVLKRYADQADALEELDLDEGEETK